MFSSCSNTPSGAIEFNTTTYYIDGKFVDEIPKSLIRKQYGYRMVDELNGKEHTYRDSTIIYPNQILTQWCTIHRGWENIKSMWMISKNGYGISISNHKKF